MLRAAAEQGFPLPHCTARNGWNILWKLQSIQYALKACVHLTQGSCSGGSAARERHANGGVCDDGGSGGSCGGRVSARSRQHRPHPAPCAAVGGRRPRTPSVCTLLSSSTYVPLSLQSSLIRQVQTVSRISFGPLHMPCEPLLPLGRTAIVVGLHGVAVMVAEEMSLGGSSRCRSCAGCCCADHARCSFGR